MSILTPRETHATLDEHGHELLSDKPISVPAGFKIPETLNEQVARLVRHERFNQAVGGQDNDTFDEADDFNVGDDFDPGSPYELVFDPILQRDISAADLANNREEYAKLYMAAAKEEIPDPPKPASKVTADKPDDPPKGDETQ